MPKVLGLVFSVSKGVSFCETIPDANPTWLNSAHRPTPDSNPSPSYLSLMVIRALAALSLFEFVDKSNKVVNNSLEDDFPFLGARQRRVSAHTAFAEPVSVPDTDRPKPKSRAGSAVRR